MTTADMINAFGAEADTNDDANLDLIHDVAWDLFNSYGAAGNTGPLAQNALTTLQAAFAAVGQLVAITDAPSLA